MAWCPAAALQAWRTHARWRSRAWTRAGAQQLRRPGRPAHPLPSPTPPASPRPPRPPKVFSYLTRVLYNRRNKMDPLWNSVVVGGVEADGTPFLGTVGMIGTHYTDRCAWLCAAGVWRG
jgi:hypothetical protein